VTFSEISFGIAYFLYRIILCVLQYVKMQVS